MIGSAWLSALLAGFAGGLAAVLVVGLALGAGVYAARAKLAKIRRR